MHAGSIFKLHVVNATFLKTKNKYYNIKECNNKVCYVNINAVLRSLFPLDHRLHLA